MKKHFLIPILMSLAFALPASASAFASEAPSAAETLITAQAVTHRDGPFRLRGDETVDKTETADGKTKRSTYYYHISGYDADATETLLQFDRRIPNPKTGDIADGTWSTRTSFLVTPNAVYAKTGSSDAAVWAEKNISAMLPDFIALGTLDQFFMLELLNGGRLSLYKEYLSAGKDAEVAGSPCRTVKADISRAQFLTLAKELTQDVKALLGPAADGMTEQQLSLTQTFAYGMLKSLDAEAHYTFYIEKSSGRILRIDSQMDTANPYGNLAPGATPRVQSKASVVLYDFGKEITRVNP